MSERDVYMHPAIKAVRAMHAEVVRTHGLSGRVCDLLEGMARTIHAAHGRGDTAACPELSNWLPAFVGRTDEAILAAALDLDQARLAVAREHGFADWADMRRRGDVRLAPLFERAADAVVLGDLGALETLIRDEPELVHRRSPFGHRATLLIYLAANGVETRRQVTPRNAPEVARRLIAAGADPGATAHVYGGEYDTASLVASSAHPVAAGVAEALIAALAATS